MNLFLRNNNNNNNNNIKIFKVVTTQRTVWTCVLLTYFRITQYCMYNISLSSSS